ncbi:unnamed protein product [Leptidea sinapis]|uniref:SIFamide n=1 Tax=Leptidea sinapis TaxID=189913 RepID=A0A5E4R5Q4_9NEOP|nr:unnamed protein product [Leptidea sinapis]
MAGDFLFDVSSKDAFGDTTCNSYHIFKMNSFMRYLILAAVVVIICFVNNSEANYKNAPMNGIMFGKRGQSDYDNRGKAFAALCEISTEACQAWFPSSENK